MLLIFDLGTTMSGLLGAMIVFITFEWYKRRQLSRGQVAEEINYTYPMLCIIGISAICIIIILLIYGPSDWFA